MVVLLKSGLFINSVCRRLRNFLSAFEATGGGKPHDFGCTSGLRRVFQRGLQNDSDSNAYVIIRSWEVTESNTGC